MDGVGRIEAGRVTRATDSGTALGVWVARAAAGRRAHGRARRGPGPPPAPRSGPRPRAQRRAGAGRPVRCPGPDERERGAGSRRLPAGRASGLLRRHPHGCRRAGGGARARPRGRGRRPGAGRPDRAAPCRAGRASSTRAGRERKDEPGDTLAARGYRLTVWVAYAARPLPALPEPVAAALDAGTLDAALHYSRAAPRRRSVSPARPGGRRPSARLAHHCLSADVAAPLVAAGILSHVVATRPDEETLLSGLHPIRQDMTQRRRRPFARARSDAKGRSIVARLGRDPAPCRAHAEPIRPPSGAPRPGPTGEDLRP